MACQLVNQTDLELQGLVFDTIVKIRYMLSSHPNWSYVRVSRKQNSMAHLLAKWAAAECRRGFVPLYCLPHAILLSDSLLESP